MGTTIDYEKLFGFKPESIGGRYRGHWIVEEVEYEEASAGAKIGDLCVKTRDNGIDYIDAEALSKPNYRGTMTDGFDSTYLYYYFSPVNQEGHGHG